MMSAYAKMYRCVLGAALAIVLACSLCPAAAFASAGSLAVDSTSEVRPSSVVATTAQAAKVNPAKRTTKKSAAYSIKHYKTVKKYGSITGKFAYGKPVVKGKSKAVKKINASLAKRYKSAASVKNSFFELVKSDSAYGTGGMYVDTYATKATFNKNGLVSFRYKWAWCAGGVANYGFYGDVYSLKTGKKLNVSQVVSGSASQVKKKIVDAIASQHTYTDVYSSAYGGGKSIYSKIMSKKASDIDFYLKNGKVIVVIDPYTIPGQRSALTVSLKGNYS